MYLTLIHDGYEGDYLVFKPDFVCVKGIKGNTEEIPFPNKFLSFQQEGKRFIVFISDIKRYSNAKAMSYVVRDRLKNSELLELVLNQQGILYIDSDEDLSMYPAWVEKWK